MDNQHQYIKGYRDLSQKEIDIMNEIKAHGEKCSELIVKLRNMPAGSDPDMRWISIGQTQLQQGFMALVRAIAKPTTF